MPRVVHFEIYVDEPGRAIKFYKKVFNWRITKWDGPIDYWLIKTGDEEEYGIDGAIIKREEILAQDENNKIIAYVCTINVVSIDKCIDKIKKSGGEIIIPKTAIPSIGWIAQCKDSEGNLFGLMTADRTI